MSRRRIAAAALFWAPTILLAGCAVEDGPLVPSAAEGPAHVAAPAAQGAPGLDGEFVRLARQVPGFGGYYFDQAGDLNIVLTDPRQEPAARAALAGVAQRGRDARNAGAAGVRVHKGEYDFIQLNEWRERARSALGIRGTVFLDTDERANRLRLGVSDPASTALVEAELRRAGVPHEAVIIEPASAVRPFATTLSSLVRPVVGGVEITFQKNDISHVSCTLGVNAKYTNYLYGYQNVGSFLTNSHCTRTKGVVDGVTYLQAAHAIAREYHDPPFWTGGMCPSGRRCRYSDAALARYDISDWSLGAIARTYVNSTTIDPWNPSHRINGTMLHPQMGDLLEKVGVVTGWTRGTVSQSCVDISWELDEEKLPSDITLICQAKVDATARDGDSGSPVFALNASGATFAGIFWGGDTQNFSFYYFSAVDNLQNDFGQASLVFF